MRRNNTIATIVTAVVFIILEAAAIAVLHYSNELQRNWISGAGHSAMAALWGGGEKVLGYFALASLNDSLAAENSHLAVRVRELEDKLSGLDGEDSGDTRTIIDRFRFTPAEIVKLSNNRQHNYIIINKGYADGVRPGAGIITGKGVVGIVERVSEHYSYGISFLNYNMSVSARLRKDGPIGPLSWDGFRNARLEEIPNHLVSQMGDTVYTSGSSAIFPRDIPLGVTVDSHLKDGATYNLEVKLFQDFSRLKYVTVVTNLDAEEINSLEKEGE